MNLDERIEEIASTLPEWISVDKDFNLAIKQLIEEEIREFVKPHLDYCMEQNGMRYCKNCKLEDPFVTEKDYMENK